MRVEPERSEVAEVRRRARPVARAAVALGLALTLAGCPARRTPYDDPAALVVAMHTGFTEQVVAAAEPWQEKHPEVKLSLAPYQPGDFAQGMIPRLITGSNIPDVMVVDAAFLSMAGRNGLLEDLGRSPYDAAALLEGFPGAVLAQAHADAALVAIPADVAPTVLFYRTDLLERAGVSAAELTASWDGFVAGCAKLRTATQTYCLPRSSELAELVLRSSAPAGPSLYFSAAGEPLADEARFARAFTLARAAREARIDAGPAPGSDGWADLVRRGRFAVLLGPPSTVRRLEVLAPGSAGLWRAAPLPGEARVAAPSAFCALSARGARKARAWDFVQKVCLEKHAQLLSWRAARAFPAAPAARASPVVDEPVAFLGDQVVGPAWREASALPVLGASRLDAFARDAVSLELDYFVDDGKDFQKAMADARDRIRRQMERGRKP